MSFDDMSEATAVRNQNVAMSAKLLALERVIRKIEEYEISRNLENASENSNFDGSMESDDSESKSIDQSISSNNINNDKASIKLYYWRIKNRGNFIRFLLEYSGIKYEDIMDSKIIKSKCACMNEMEIHNRRFDAFAPPFIEHNGYIFSQTVTIQSYIAQLTNLKPKLAINNGLCNMILENLNDFMIEMYQYIDDKTGDTLLAFLNGRFQAWLDIFEKPLSMQEKENKNDNDNGSDDKDVATTNYYFENTVTVADISVACLLDGFQELFSIKYDKFIGDRHPFLKKLHQTIVKHPNIDQLLKRQEKQGLQFFYDSKFENMKKVILNL